MNEQEWAEKFKPEHDEDPFEDHNHRLEMAHHGVMIEEEVDDWDTPLTAEWLRSIGALPGEEEKIELDMTIWAKGQTESYGTEPGMSVVWSSIDNSLWLESYGIGGETLALIELNIESTRGAYRSLFQSLGSPLREPE